MRLLNITGMLILLLFGTACTDRKNTGLTENGKDQTGLQAEIRFEKTDHHMGKILQGEKVGYNFTFTNEGDAALVILDASASCGCTVPKYSKDPISPGAKGSVEVVFDSSGRIGLQNKTVTIKTNGKVPVIHLTIKADIIRSES
jgi:hypothetical protein